MAKRHNVRCVKIHHGYTVSELAKVLGTAKLTVRRWIDAGLPVVVSTRPQLIHGSDLHAFLKARQPRKQPCRPGQIYCVRCRAPKRPAFDEAEYTPTTAKTGLLGGLCPDCGGMIYRVARLASLATSAGDLKVTHRPARQRITDISSALSNVPFKGEAR